MEPLVTVICITRNHESFCIESLDSVLNQTYKNIEWIILDAASIDNTVGFIDNWLVENNVQAVFLKEKVLKSITVNLNKALTYAKGEYVQFLSLDDVLFEEKIAKNVECLMELPRDYSAVYSDALVIDEKNFLKNESFIKMHRNFDKIPSGGNPFFDILCAGNFIPMMSMIFRMSSITGIKGFDERIDYEDYDLHLRLTKVFKYYYLDEHLVKYRIHGENLHLNLNLRDDVLIFLKHLDTRIGREMFEYKLKLVLKNPVKKDLEYLKKNIKLSNVFFCLPMMNIKLSMKIFRRIIGIYTSNHIDLD